MTSSDLGGRVERLLTAGRQFTRGASLATLVLMAAALVGLASASSHSPAWVAFAQERFPPPAPPVAPVAPAPPLAPAPPAAPAPPQAPAPPPPPSAPSLGALERQMFILQAQKNLEAQAEAIRLQEEHLREQKLDLERRQAELQRMADRLRPLEESLQRQVEELRRRLEETMRQQQR